MIYNLLKFRWISESMLSALRILPDQFSVYMLTHQNDKIPVAVLTGTERFVKAIVVEFMDGRKVETYTINERFPEPIMVDIGKFVTEHQIKNQPKKHDLQSMQSIAATNTAKNLGIDNNIDQLPRQITFNLNDYTTSERERMIAYLQAVDSSSVDVVINLDFSKCSKEQLESNEDFLLMAGAISTKE